MKISKKTLEMLNSFKNINPSLYFDGSNKYAMKNVNREQGQDIPINTVLAIAEFEEDFPEFAIYDSKQFLDCLNIFKDPDIEFESNKVITISGERGSSIKYVGCSKELLSIPKTKEFDLEKNIVSFVMEKSMFIELVKIGNYLKNEYIQIEGLKEGEVVLTLYKEAGGNEYKKVFSEKSPVIDFKSFLKLRDLQVINDDYMCSVMQDNMKRNFLFLEGLHYKIKYYIILQEEIG